MNPTAEKILNLRNVLRLCSVLLIIFFFIPSFMVSCSGANVEISAMNAMAGLSVEGQQVSAPSPLMVLALLLPAAILIFTFLGKVMKEKLTSILCLCMAGAHIVLYIIFMINVRNTAAQSMCTFRIRPGFILNVIFAGLAAVAALLPIIGVKGLDDCLAAPGGIRPAPKRPAQPRPPVPPQPYQQRPPVPPQAQPPYQQPPQMQQPQQPQQPQQGYIQSNPGDKICYKCGNIIPAGQKFCARCGTPAMF